jgi:hypothetical protein
MNNDKEQQLRDICSWLGMRPYQYPDSRVLFSALKSHIKVIDPNWLIPDDLDDALPRLLWVIGKGAKP